MAPFTSTRYVLEPLLAVESTSAQQLHESLLACGFEEIPIERTRQGRGIAIPRALIPLNSWVVFGYEDDFKTSPYTGPFRYVDRTKLSAYAAQLDVNDLDALQRNQGIARFKEGGLVSFPLAYDKIDVPYEILHPHKASTGYQTISEPFLMVIDENGGYARRGPLRGVEENLLEEIRTMEKDPAMQILGAIAGEIVDKEVAFTHVRESLPFFFEANTGEEQEQIVSRKLRM